MGYRLNVTNEDKTIDFYNTKHYGYSFTNAKDGGLAYPSYCYLLELGKITGDEVFDYGLDLEITLTADQFKEFIGRYAYEIEWPSLLETHDIALLLKDKGNKTLSWW